MCSVCLTHGTMTTGDDKQMGGQLANVQGGVESNSTPSAFRPIGLIRHNGCPILSGDTGVESGGVVTRQTFIE